jgi:hypothetical protein
MARHGFPLPGRARFGAALSLRARYAYNAANIGDVRVLAWRRVSQNNTGQAP